jgi:hypothetical protein
MNDSWDLMPKGFLSPEDSPLAWRTGALWNFPVGIRTGNVQNLSEKGKQNMQTDQCTKGTK